MHMFTGEIDSFEKWEGILLYSTVTNNKIKRNGNWKNRSCLLISEGTDVPVGLLSKMKNENGITTDRVFISYHLF